MKKLALERYQISNEAAESAVSACARYARSLNAAVSIAIVDTGGHLMAFLRADGAPFHTRGVAEDKAITAASFGIPTRTLAEALRAQPELVRSGLQLRPQFVMLAGGLPILFQGKVIGAIGVSGATEEIDERIAAAGLDALLTD
jgi:uncharacterized protein GlcG (DUF336 family)